MRDDSLLKLEKKLDSYSTKDILLTKFVLKPKIDKSEITQGRDFLKSIGGFINEFKKQNGELLNDENKVKELNIEEGAELAKNNSKRAVEGKKNLKKNSRKNQTNNINADIINEEDANRNDKKFIELNLKLGVLDLIKKQNNEKVLIEEVNTDKDKKEYKEHVSQESSDGSESSETSEKNEDMKFIKIGQNKNNFNNNKGKNYLDVLTRNDNILQSILNKGSGDSTSDRNTGLDEYPFLDLKNDAFNKEVLNFLLENSKNKSEQEGMKTKKRKVLSARNKNKVNNNNNNYDEINFKDK